MIPHVVPQFPLLVPFSLPAPGALTAVLAGLACLLALPVSPRGAVRRLGRVTAPGAGGTTVPPGAGTSVRLPGPVLLDLVAAVLHAGVPVGVALRLVGTAAEEHGDGHAAEHLHRLADRHDLGLESVPGAGPPWVRALDDAVLSARDAGVAVAPLLMAPADQERRREGAAARVAAARLGVQVVLPTGLCLLPAFVLLAVVPLVLALLGVG